MSRGESEAVPHPWSDDRFLTEDSYFTVDLRYGAESLTRLGAMQSSFGRRRRRKTSVTHFDQGRKE